MALLMVGASPAVFTEVEAHSHNCFEIIMNTEGEGTAVIGGRDYPFSPGTIHVVPPNTPHRKYAGTGFRDLYLHTDGGGRTGGRIARQPAVLRTEGPGDGSPGSRRS